MFTNLVAQFVKMNWQKTPKITLFTYCIFQLFLSASCQTKNPGNPESLVGEWLSYASLEAPATTHLDAYKTTIEYSYKFNKDGTGRKIEKQGMVTGTVASTHTIEYPFEWQVKTGGKEDYIEIKYYQGELKEVTPDNLAQQKIIKDRMLKTSGSEYRLYLISVEERKIICHVEGDSTRLSFIKKAG